MKKSLDISWESIFKIFVAVLLFYLLFNIKEIVVWVVFALIISVLFEPIIGFLKKKNIPRVISAIIIYLGFFGILGFLSYLIIPFFITEIKGFVNLVPEYFNKIYPPLQELGFLETAQEEFSAIKQSLDAMAVNVFSFLITIFGGLASALFIITVSFFFSLQGNKVQQGIIVFFPKKYEEFAYSLWARCQKRVSAWFLARIAACLFVGIVSYIVFFLFNLEYPLILATLAGVLNFIPYVGPLITTILLFILLAPVNLTQAVFVVIAFSIIQQVETAVVTPLLMKKAIGMPPSLVLISLVIGAQLWGFLGAILVIPLVGIIAEFIREFLKKKKEKEVITP